tara:strand:+ start:962 stop:1294 length:333 start_codon:yes stop_codon:yes gene_type:complete
MRKGNTLADLLPADTKKQLINITKNYKPVPKINNKHALADFELDRTVANPVEDPTNIIKENERLANKINELTVVLVQAVKDLNHLIEAKEIEKSIIKEMKDGIYSRWKQL